MKIVVITNGLAGGGVERASTSMAGQFARWGHAVYVLALYRSEHFLPLDLSITFIEPENERRSRLYVFSMIRYVRKMIKRIKPDTVLAYNEWTNPYVLFALRGLGIPVYVTDRMSPLIKCPMITEILKRKYYKEASGIIAQTDFAKHIIGERTGATNIVSIPNPVNAIERVDCVKRNYFVTVGRLTREKGHKCLIEAFARVKDTSWKLSIVGDGAERPALEKLAVDLGVRDRIIFHGHLLHFEEQLSEARIFVLPSLSEGYPNAVIEAMSVPLPCISTRCTPAMEEVIDDEVNGLLVEKNNPGALAAAMERLMSDVVLQGRLAQNAYLVRDKLAFDKISEKYLNFITV